MQHDLTIEEVDALTGPLIGLPKSASYRLLDIVGIDVWAHVTDNLYAAAPRDPFRERFRMEPFIVRNDQRGWLGDKRGQGFFKRVGKDREIHAIDRKTFEYHPAAQVRFPSLETVRKIEPLADRLKAVVALDDKAGRFLWQVLSDHVVYAAHMVPEISNRIVEIDRAMRWGYANELGPFELWDALGFRSDGASHRSGRPRTARERPADAVRRARSRSTARRMRTAQPRDRILRSRAQRYIGR